VTYQRAREHSARMALSAGGDESARDQSRKRALNSTIGATFVDIASRCIWRPTWVVVQRDAGHSVNGVT